MCSRLRLWDIGEPALLAADAQAAEQAAAEQAAAEQAAAEALAAAVEENTSNLMQTAIDLRERPDEAAAASEAGLGGEVSQLIAAEAEAVPSTETVAKDATDMNTTNERQHSFRSKYTDGQVTILYIEGCTYCWF